MRSWMLWPKIQGEAFNFSFRKRIYGKRRLSEIKDTRFQNLKFISFLSNVFSVINIIYTIFIKLSSKGVKIYSLERGVYHKTRQGKIINLKVRRNIGFKEKCR